MLRLTPSVALRRRPLLRILAALLLVGALAACERPFAEPLPPILTIVEPADPGLVIDQDRVAIAVRTQSQRVVDYVEVAGQTLDRGTDGLWHGEVALANGLNVLPVRALDVDDAEVVDTLFLLRATLSVSAAAPALPAPRAGHTATLLADGSVLVLGGVEHIDGPAVDDGFLLGFGTDGFDRLGDVLVAPRAGHTATRLPDGRVLVLGGATRFAPGSVADLEERAEVYDPSTGTSTVLALDGIGLRRAHHTAILREEGPEPVVEVFGGWGDLRPGASPRLGIRSDIRRFRIVGQSLVALDGPLGVTVPGLDVPVAGHTASPLGVSRAEGRVAPEHLILGARSAEGFDESISALLREDLALGLLAQPSAAPPGSRTYHAAVVESAGSVLFVGGLDGGQAPVAAPWLYDRRADTYFRFPPVLPQAGRWGAAATNTFDGRILAIGGVDLSRSTVATTLVFDVSY